MKENWYALFVCIFKNISIDTAIVKMRIRASNPSGKQKNPRESKYSVEFVNTLLNLKNQGKSYNEIGIIMGLTRDQAAGVARMYKEKSHRTPTKVVQMA